MKIETPGKSFVTLTKDPKDIGKKSAMVVFGVAENHNRKNEDGDWEREGTSFYDVVAYGELGDEVYDDLKKGDSIGLTGKIRMTVWEDKEGDKHVTPQIILETYEKTAFKKSPRKNDRDDKPSSSRRQSSSRNSSSRNSRGRRAPWQD